MFHTQRQNWLSKRRVLRTCLCSDEPGACAQRPKYQEKQKKGLREAPDKLAIMCLAAPRAFYARTVGLVHFMPARKASTISPKAGMSATQQQKQHHGSTAGWELMLEPSASAVENI